MSRHCRSLAATARQRALTFSVIAELRGLGPEHAFIGRDDEEGEDVSQGRHKAGLLLRRSAVVQLLAPRVVSKGGGRGRGRGGTPEGVLISFLLERDKLFMRHSL